MIINLIRKHSSLLHKPALLCLCAAFIVGACERTSPRVANGMPLPAQTYAHVERLPVNVGNVQILRDDQVAGQRYGDFSVSLYDQAMLYFSQKFETKGTFHDPVSGGQLVINIEDIGIQHSQRASDHRVFQTIGVDRVDQYDLALSIRLEHRDNYGRVLYGKVLSVDKRINISEHLSPAAREQAQFDAVEEMFMLLDPQMNRVIRDEMNLLRI